MSEKTYTKPDLRSRIKSQVMAGSDGGKPGQWSARKAQLVAQKYEDAGGGYKGPKTEGQKSLAKWTDEKWTTSDGKPAEKPDGTMRRYLPEKAWDKLTPAQKAATNKKKVEASRKGQQFVSNTPAAQEARKEAGARDPGYASSSILRESKMIAPAAEGAGGLGGFAGSAAQPSAEKTAAPLSAYLGGAAVGGLGGAYLDDEHRVRGAGLGALAGLGAVGLGSAAFRALKGRAAPTAVKQAPAITPPALTQVATPVAAPTSADAHNYFKGPVGSRIAEKWDDYLGVRPEHWTPEHGLNALGSGADFTSEELAQWAKTLPGVVEHHPKVGDLYDPSIMRSVNDIGSDGEAFVTEALSPAYFVPGKPAIMYGDVRASYDRPSMPKTASRAESNTVRKIALLTKHENPKGGLTEAGRRHFERSGESKDLKPGVKKPESEMSVQDMKRKGSWARRFYGRNPLPPLKKPNGEPTRLALTANAWGEPVPESVGAARAIAAKGTRLLEKAKAREGQEKKADIQTELKPHQQRVIERIKAQPGLVVAHGMGSGKTLSSIAAAEELGGPATVLVPAALQANYEKEIAKHVGGDPRAEFNISSLQRAARQREIAPAKTLIVDEAHRLRDPGSLARKAVRDAEVEKRLLLTGTPLYNRPYDLASLVNVAANQNIFPGSQADFDKLYLGEKVTQPGWYARTFKGVQPGTTPVIKNEGELGKHLRQWVDFHENTSEGFPMRQDEVIHATMSPKQQELYDFALGDAPAWVKYKIQHGLPPSKAESKDLNAFAGAVRQIATSPGGFAKDMTPEQAAMHSPKLQAAYQRLAKNIAENPAHRAVVYSNFLDAGLTPYESLLKQHNIAYGKFTGDIPKRERDQMVKDYNAGKLKALLLSSAGGEGLDLKGTRQIQVLEPHWNKEKLEQVIARGIRYKSHEHLPEDQRKVLVEHYVSQMPEPGALKKLIGAKRPGAIDEYLRMMSEEKDLLNQQVKNLLKQPPEKAKTSSLPLGVLGGAAIGGLTGAAAAGEDANARARGGLTGALAGGALGGAIGYGLDRAEADMLQEAMRRLRAVGDSPQALAGYDEWARHAASQDNRRKLIGAAAGGLGSLALGAGAGRMSKQEPAKTASLSDVLSRHNDAVKSL